MGRSEMKIPDAGRRIRRQIAIGTGGTVRKQHEADMRHMHCTCNLMAEVIK
jgi:hypothetical protein